MDSKPCARCGAPVENPGKYWKKYCSKKCRYGAIVDRAQERATEDLKSGVKQCASCGRRLPFAEFWSDSTKVNGLSSSCRPCNRDYFARRMRKERGGIEIACAGCGSMFDTYGRPRTAYCSPDCFRKAKERWSTEGVRHCNMCGEDKALEDFGRNSAGVLGRQSVCRTCQTRQARVWNRANPESVRAYKRRGGIRRAWRAGPEDGWLRWLRLMEVQSGKCALCESPSNLVADHCHRTGTPRAILCRRCNLRLGSFGDDPEELRKSADYIESYRTAEVEMG